MKFRITFFFCLLFAVSIQKLAAQKALAYYELVNKAEMAIVHKQLPEALSLYKKAFSVNPNKPFSEDLYRAFHCAMDLEDCATAEQYLAILLRRGLSSKFLNGYIYKYYSGDLRSELDGMMKRHINDTIHSSSINKAIQRLIDIDQNTRWYWSAKVKNGSYMTDSTYKADNYCAKSLFNLFVEYGKVPNQEDLGNTIWDSPLQSINYAIIILHNRGAYMVGMPYTIFDTLIYKAIFTYDYKPIWFAKHFSHGGGAGMDNSIRYKGAVIQFSLDAARKLPLYARGLKRGEIPYGTDEYWKEIAAMNKDREKIGLCPIEEYWAKRDFMEAEAKTPYAKYAFY